MAQATATQLSDLFNVFARLEAGESIVLASQSADSEPALSTTGTDITSGGGWLGFRSSGSAGRPKLVWRSWADLAAGVRTDERFLGWTWASSFTPESFAGVQVALQAWRAGGRVVSLGKDWRRNWELINKHLPAALSCTPTFLDLLLQFEDRTAWVPEQITLGGEVLRASAGERFRARFVTTRFTVIYASAENGVLLKTHRLDGWYETRGLGIRSEDWRVNDDVLELRRGDLWISTHDRVEVRERLIRIVGRADAVINVGGVKVSLDEISRLAEDVPGVRRAVAFAVPNPIVGEVVGLRFALESNYTRQAVQHQLESHLRASLPKEAWPRYWEVDLVGLGPNSKRAAYPGSKVVASGAP